MRRHSGCGFRPIDYVTHLYSRACLVGPVDVGTVAMFNNVIAHDLLLYVDSRDFQRAMCMFYCTAKKIKNEYKNTRRSHRGIFF